MNKLVSLLLLLLITPGWADDRAIRLEAFANGPLVFSSSVALHAIGLSLSRATSCTLTGSSAGIGVTLIQGNRTSTTALAVTADGAFTTELPDFVNVCNIGALTPGLRRMLSKSFLPVSSESRIEIMGRVTPIKVVHTRNGEVATDGSMKVCSKATSGDGRVQLTTDTTLAPDGLPWLTETYGAVTKGLVTIKLRVKLERKMR